MAPQRTIEQIDVDVQSGDATLAGTLAIPDGAAAIVIFAHGSGSSRLSPRNQSVAHDLNDAGFATLLFDLLTAEEGRIDEMTRELRFDIDLLANRLTGVIDWTRRGRRTSALRIGLFGASTGAAAALVAAANRPKYVGAVVSRGGRPDLAGAALPAVRAPTLLIVGGADLEVIALNERAAQLMHAPHEIEIIEGATHLFPEPGAMEEVVDLVRKWFSRHLIDVSVS